MEKTLRKGVSGRWRDGYIYRVKSVSPRKLDRVGQSRLQHCFERECGWALEYRESDEGQAMGVKDPAD